MIHYQKFDHFKKFMVSVLHEENSEIRKNQIDRYFDETNEQLFDQVLN